MKRIILSVKDICLLQEQNDALLKQNRELQQENKKLQIENHMFFEKNIEYVRKSDKQEIQLSNIKDIAEQVVADIDKYNNVAYSPDAVCEICNKILKIIEFGGKVIKC